MDNVVQNIRLEDIIPSNFQNNNSKKIEELVDSIKKFGIIEPLLIRPKNGKYEIILGNKRYQAARILGLQTIPALVKDIDDEIFNQYLMINNNKNNQNTTKFINLSPNNEQPKRSKEKTESLEHLPSKNEISQGKQNNLTNTNFKMNYNTNKTTDIVNLAELNKEEYERNDINMNNELMNNNVMNNIGDTTLNTNSSMQEPTFGGRFFPSLEDEPTNMNVGGTNNNSMNISNNQPINNLIDLTDIGLEKTVQPPLTQAFTTLDTMQNQTSFIPNIPSQNQQTIMSNPMNIESVSSQDLSNPITDPTNGIINIGNLQASNHMIQPETVNIDQPMMTNNVSMPEQIMEPVQNIPQFDMSQSITPTEVVQNQTINSMPEINIPQNDFMMNTTDEFSMNQTETTPYITPIITQTMSNPEIYNQNLGMDPQINQMPINEPIPTNEVTAIPQKEVTPVINTIKTLVANLEAFGYKININEEELSTSVKLTIEVEK